MSLGSLFGSGRKPNTPNTRIGGDPTAGSRPREGRPITGYAITREEYAKRQAAAGVDATNPPDAIQDESAAVSDAYGAAARTRRRARAGNAGRVKLPGGPGAGSTSTQRTLLGY